MKNKIVIDQRYSYTDTCYEISIDISKFSDKTKYFRCQSTQSLTTIRFKTEKSNNEDMYHIYKDGIYDIVGDVCEEFDINFDDVSFLKFDKSGWFGFILVNAKNEFNNYVYKNKINPCRYLCDVKLEKDILYDIVFESIFDNQIFKKYEFLFETVFANNKMINFENNNIYNFANCKFTYNGI